MKKIVSLTKVFVKEYYQNLPIFDNKKLNKKSVFFWLVVIVLLGLTYISYETLLFLVKSGRPEIFLNIYFPMLAIILSFQAILASGNIFFFSKDIEKVLHMPIKPVELLISKLNTLISISYVTEAIFAFLPIVLYGIMTNKGLLYYLFGIVVLAIFPILIDSIAGILTLIVMRFAKLTNNKEAFQIITTAILMISVFFVQYALIQEVFAGQNNVQAIEQLTSISDRAKDANKKLLIINPAIDMMTGEKNIDGIISFLKIIFYNIIALVVLIIIGKITYLKDILRNMVSSNKSKKQIKSVEFINKLKTKGIAKSYINKEIKNIIKEPTFFMQCIFPVLTLLAVGIALICTFWPSIMVAMQEEEMTNLITNLSFNTEAVCDIFIILQVLFSISNISLTAFSRDGKNAIFAKYIPVELYKQFVYKNIPQILLNLLITIIVLGLFCYIVPNINIVYMLIIFLIATVINLINSYLMLIVDLRRPNLDWDSEYAVVKKSDNKLFQYALMIGNILLLLYIARIFKDIDIMSALGIELLIYFVIFITIDRCVKKWQKKLFNKII